jgi:hypothetical protein
MHLGNYWAIGLGIAGLLGVLDQIKLAWVAVLVTALLALVG